MEAADHIKAAIALLEKHEFGQKDWLIGDVLSRLEDALKSLETETK